MELLRASQDEILAGSVSTLRGLIWSGLGQPSIAGEFLQDAMNLIGARDRSLVQSVSQRIKKAFYDKFSGSLIDADDQRLEQFVRENVEEVLASVLSDERRRQERDMHDILQSFPISNDETMILAAQ